MVLPVYVDRMLSAVALDVSCDINVKKSSSLTSETDASSDEFPESLVAAAKDCCCCINRWCWAVVVC